ncbi:MAG: type II toxin-antitoxin system RelE/ParE family toxin [Xanthobacteraceae bacterium]
MLIRSFRSKALQRFWNEADARGIRPDQVARVGRVLLELDVASRPEDLNLPGYRFHPLQSRPRRYSVTVTRTWRITFEWDGEDALRVDYEDYH